MTIHWFPGHMSTARDELRKAMPGVDLVIEVLDARIPFSSENPLVADLRGARPSIRILNKADLADPAVTADWLVAANQRPGVAALAHHHSQPDLLRRVLKVARDLVPNVRDRRLVAAILGVPNVGKSTLINTLVGRTVARTGNKPALTQSQQRVMVGTELALIDTPGFLWPKLEPQICGYRLAVMGAISDRVVNPEELALLAFEALHADYGDCVERYYGAGAETTDGMALLAAIGRRRGFVGKGGVVDTQRAADRFLMDLRAGALGRFSLETPARCEPAPA